MDLRKTGPQTRGLSRLPNSHVFARHLLKFNEQAEKKPVTTGGMESSIDWLTPEWRRLSRDAVKHPPPHFITQ